ncbi:MULTISPECIES: hormogonium polysaccharide secretion pseudopilin HpsC [unclassified Microcoleus]|uniref:hormogonium polysaccharide secretion pseudopilin HpsC n=1 Tax=unclassified Microcoleus TaxID=2642155 RepID=UPI002FD1F7C6
MKTLLRLLLKTQHQRNRSAPAQTEKGMTLVELLVGSIMAFLIITPMLAFVVDMLNTDRREQVKSNTEQDLQAAVDFIAQDLSQAIYIYDNDPTTGIPAIKSFLPPQTNKTPILVFWKRQVLKNSLPVDINLTPQPDKCDSSAKPGTAGECNDTYVLSLVAYYQIKDTDSTWCQPQGSACPTRIARYQIQDGLENKSSDPTKPYTGLNSGQKTSPAYNGTPVGTTPAFDITKPEQNVTNLPPGNWDGSDVLVNYIDHSKVALVGNECTLAFNNPKDSKGDAVLETTLRVTDSPAATDTNSFYACVDRSNNQNIARVTIRGNSLRRLQANDADFKSTSSAFFPTATVQVQGLGARGK